MDTLRQKETIKDHLLINALMTLAKILQECSVLTKKRTANMTAEAWGECDVLLYRGETGFGRTLFEFSYIMLEIKFDSIMATIKCGVSVFIMLFGFFVQIQF